MLLSLCTPVMDRLKDLKRTMEFRLAQAAASPPVELVVLDYNSQDRVWDYFCELKVPQGVVLTYRRYSGRSYYHQAHAYNLAVLSSAGEAFTVMGADTFPRLNFFSKVRGLLETGYDWLEDERYKGAITCRRTAFVEAGGYDERFEFYGPEDRELAERLARRGLRKGILPPGVIGNFHTPDSVKVANYRIRADKHELSAQMRPIYEQSQREGWLVGNEGKEWGQWT